MSEKVRLNYALDAVIALAFIGAAVTGIVLLLAGSGGYQGGRNPGFDAFILGTSRGTWRDLHNWVGLVLMAGVVVHLALHWNWIFCTTKRLLRPVPNRSREESCPTV